MIIVRMVPRFGSVRFQPRRVRAGGERDSVCSGFSSSGGIRRSDSDLVASRLVLCRSSPLARSWMEWHTGQEETEGNKS